MGRFPWIQFAFLPASKLLILVWLPSTERSGFLTTASQEIAFVLGIILTCIEGRCCRSHQVILQPLLRKRYVNIYFETVARSLRWS